MKIHFNQFHFKKQVNFHFNGIFFHICFQMLLWFPRLWSSPPLPKVSEPLPEKSA